MNVTRFQTPARDFERRLPAFLNQLHPLANLQRRRTLVALIGTIGNTMTKSPKVVLDTNVLVAGLRSRNGASFQLLSRLTTTQFSLHLTVPLAMEYEDVLHRPGLLALPIDAIDAVLDMVCAVAIKQDVHFLWRPQLRDPNDELVLEAAVNASADFLVTYSLRDFAASSRFAVQVITPAQLLKLLDGETP